MQKVDIHAENKSFIVGSNVEIEKQFIVLSELQHEYDFLVYKYFILNILNTCPHKEIMVKKLPSECKEKTDQTGEIAEAHQNVYFILGVFSLFSCCHSESFIQISR